MHNINRDAVTHLAWVICVLFSGVAAMYGLSENTMYSLWNSSGMK